MNLEMTSRENEDMEDRVAEHDERRQSEKMKKDADKKVIIMITMV